MLYNTKKYLKIQAIHIHIKYITYNTYNVYVYVYVFKNIAY